MKKAYTELIDELAWLPDLIEKRLLEIEDFKKKEMTEKEKHEKKYQEYKIYLSKR